MKLFVLAVSTAAAVAMPTCKFIMGGRCFFFEDNGVDACEGDFAPPSSLCDSVDLVSRLLDEPSTCTDTYRLGAANSAVSSSTASAGGVKYLDGVSRDGVYDSCAAYSPSDVLQPRDFDDCAIATCDGKIQPTRCAEPDSPSDYFSGTTAMTRHSINFGDYENAIQLKASGGFDLCDIELENGELLQVGGDLNNPDRATNDEHSNEYSWFFKSCASASGNSKKEIGTFTAVAGSGSVTMTTVTSKNKPVTVFVNDKNVGTVTSGSSFDTAQVVARGTTSPAGPGVLRKRSDRICGNSGLVTEFIDVASNWGNQKLCPVGEDCSSDATKCVALDQIIAKNPGSTSNNRYMEVDSGTVCSFAGFDNDFIGDTSGANLQGSDLSYECVFYPLLDKESFDDSLVLGNLEPATQTLEHGGRWCMSSPDVCVDVEAGDEVACALGAFPFNDPAAMTTQAGGAVASSTGTLNGAKCALIPKIITANKALCGPIAQTTFVAAAEGASTLEPIKADNDWTCHISFFLNSAPQAATSAHNLFRVGNTVSTGSGNSDAFRLPQLDLVSPSAELTVSYTIADENGQPILGSDGKWEVASCTGAEIIVGSVYQDVEITFFEETLTIKRSGGTTTCENMPPVYVPTPLQSFQVTGAGLFSADADIQSVFCSGIFTASPTVSPTTSPTESPSASPTESPSASPTASPSESPSASPSASPSETPTASPSISPSATPTAAPTQSPTNTDLDFNDLGLTPLLPSFRCDTVIKRTEKAGTLDLSNGNGGVFRVGDAVGQTGHQNLPTVLLTADWKVQVLIDVLAVVGGVDTPITETHTSTTAIDFNDETPVSIRVDSSGGSSKLIIIVAGKEDVYTLRGPMEIKDGQVNADFTAHPRGTDAVGYDLIGDPACGPLSTEAPVAAPTNSPVAAPTNSPVAAPTNSPVAAPTNSPEAAPTTSPVVSPVTPGVECVDTKLLVVREETFNSANENQRLSSHEKFLGALLGDLPVGSGVQLAFKDVNGATVGTSINAAATVSASAAKDYVQTFISRQPPALSSDAEVDFYQILVEANAMAGFNPESPQPNNGQYDKTVVHILFDGEPVANKDGAVLKGKAAFDAACDMRKLQREFVRDDLLVFCQVTDRGALSQKAKRVNKCVCDGTFVARSDGDSAVAAVSPSDDVKTEEEAAERMRTFFCRTAEEITTTDPSRCTTKDGDKDKCKTVKASTFGKPVRPDVSEPYSLLFRTGRACNYEAGKCVDKPDQLHNVDGAI